MSIQQQLKGITNRIDLKMNRAAQAIMTETRDEFKKSIDNLWYSSYSPKDYVRTYELINSVNGRVVKNNQGDYSIEVYFDDTLMTSRPSLYGWGTHSGFDGGDFRKGLIESVIHGMRGSYYNPRHGEATNVIKVVQQAATQYANSLLRKYL